MPIYEYRCDACGFEDEYLQKMSEPTLTVCPECGKTAFTKLVSAAGFHLKGSGWYVTDFKNKPKPKSAESKTESKTEDKSGAKAEDQTQTKSEDKTSDKAAEKPVADTGTNKSEDVSSKNKSGDASSKNKSEAAPTKKSTESNSTT